VGDEKKIESDPINELVALYQNFTASRENPELNNWR